MILFGTGHRPDKLAPGNKRLAYSAYCFQRQVDCAAKMLGIHKPKLVISGMALGWDQALAQAAVNLGIPYHAYVPCKDHDSRWLPASRAYYQRLLAQAQHVNLITDLIFDEAPGCMQRRNVAMIDASTFCLALWDGSPGGTGNCMRVVLQRGMPYYNAWSSWVTYSKVYPRPVVAK